MNITYIKCIYNIAIAQADILLMSSEGFEQSVVLTQGTNIEVYSDIMCMCT